MQKFTLFCIEMGLQIKMQKSRLSNCFKIQMLRSSYINFKKLKTTFKNTICFNKLNNNN
jgi:hypothetical protein